MPTKFYLTGETAPYTPATIRGAWDDSASAVTRGLATNGGGSAGTTISQLSVAETNVATEYDVLLYRGVSGPLSAQTISGTVDGLVGVSISSAAANAHYHLHIYVTQGDSDTPRGTLVADYREAAGVNEWSASGTPTGRALNAAQALSSLAITAGDRLVIEIGYTARNIVTTLYTGHLNYGVIRNGRDLIAGGLGEYANGYIVFSGTVAEESQDVRVSQLVVETISAQAEPVRVTQLVVETLSPVSVPVYVTQLVVETLTPVLVPSGVLTTTRTDRAVFPTNAVIGTDDLPDASVLRLGTLTSRAVGEDLLAVTDDGEVVAGALTVADLPAHAVTHQAGGVDPIALDTLAAPTDVTTLNASTSAHGLLRKLSGSPAQFLDGTGAWATPVRVPGQADVIESWHEPPPLLPTTLSGAPRSTALVLGPLPGGVPEVWEDLTEAPIPLATRLLGDPLIAFTSAWTSTGTAPAIGNGTLTGSYYRLPDSSLVWFSLVLTWGSTTTGGTGTWYFSLPFPAAAATHVGALASPLATSLHDSAAGQYTALALLINAGADVFVIWANAVGQAVTAIAPFTWKTTDALTISGWYLKA